MAPHPQVPAAGIDLGGTKCLGVVLDGDGEIEREERAATPVGADDVLRVVHQVALVLGPVPRLGVGAAGLVDGDGVLHAAPNLTDVDELALGPELRARLGRDVLVENDATCAAFAEWRLGAGRGASDMVLVTLGTGIGAGLVTGGRLQRGAHGFAGEPGHMIVDPSGPPCVCGQRGCWERYASGSALAALAQEAVGKGELSSTRAAAEVRGEDVEAAARRGDESALAVLDRFAASVALGLVNLTNILDPEVIVLGGGVSPVLDLVIDPIRRHLADLIYASPRRPLPRVVAAALGERAGAVGAALLAAERPPAGAR